MCACYQLQGSSFGGAHVSEDSSNAQTDMGEGCLRVKSLWWLSLSGTLEEEVQPNKYRVELTLAPDSPLVSIAGAVVTVSDDHGHEFDGSYTFRATDLDPYETGKSSLCVMWIHVLQPCKITVKIEQTGGMYFGGWSIHSLALKPADLPLDHNTVILNQGQAEFVDYIAASDPSQQSKEEIQPSPVMNHPIIVEALEAIQRTATLCPELYDEDPYPVIAAACEAAAQAFCDPVFPPHWKSMCPVSEYDNTYASSYPRRWERLTTVFGEKTQVLVDGFDITDVQQGGMGNCCWVAQLASLANNAEVFDPMLFPRTVSPWGLYTVRYFIDGQYRWVLIDDFIPVCGEGDKIYPWSCRSTCWGEIWPCLVEKSWAKLHQSYLVLDGHFGEVDHRVRYPGLLLGSVCDGEYVGFGTDPDTKEIAWERLCWLTSVGTMMTSSSVVKLGEFDQGIVGFHGYSFLGTFQEGDIRLVKLRNTWAHFEWTGDWSDESPLWEEHPDIMAAVNFVKKNDGIFFMSYDDFLEKFHGNIYAVLRLQSLDWVVLRDKEYLDETNKFLGPEYGNWHKNTQWQVVCTQKCKLHCNSEPPDTRFMKEKGWLFHYLTVVKNPGGGLVQSYNESDVLQKEPCWGARARTGLFELEPGTYNIVYHVGWETMNFLASYTFACSDPGATIQRL